jgi:hypothetical protein
MSEAYSESEIEALQLENEKARATRVQFARERHTATVQKMKGMASHQASTSYSTHDTSYSFPSMHDTSVSSAEMSLEQSPGMEAFETSFLQLQQHEIGATSLPANAYSHDTDEDTIEGGERAVNVSLADLDTSFETVESQYSTDEFDREDELNIGMETNVNNISRSSHESLFDIESNLPEEGKEGYEKDESIQCVYSTFGAAVGELFEFCLMGDVVPQKKKSSRDKARKMFFKDKKEMETDNAPPYTDSQRKAVEEMFGPASSGSRSEKEEASSCSDTVGGGGLLDRAPSHRVPSHNASQQQTSEAILALELSKSRSSSDKNLASASGGLKDDSSPRNVPLTPIRFASDDFRASTNISTPKPQRKAKVPVSWKAKVPVSSQISATPSSDASANIRTRRERSQRAKEMQRKKYGHKSIVSDDSPLESSRGEQRPPTYDTPSVTAKEAPPSREASSPVVPKDTSPLPVHKRPQFEHFSALSSDEIANNANQYKTGDKPFDHASHPSTGREYNADESASSLALDVSAIKCTSSYEEAEPLSTTPVKSVSRVVADTVPETPRTTNRSFTTPQMSSGGKWISPDGKWISPDARSKSQAEAKPPAPKKSHGAVTEQNFEAGTARKQLFGALDHVAAEETSSPVGPKDASPLPAHKRPQWEHFSALSSDEIASSLALDVSAIKFTNSDDQTEPRSVSISITPVKIMSSVDADVDPETPRTTNRSLTASQKIGGVWISPSASTNFESPLTKAAPQKSHGAVSERNIEPGAARKQLFRELDQPEEMPNTSNATDITENYLEAVRTSSFFESPSRKSATEATHATPGIFKSQPAHDDTMTTANTEEDSGIPDFDLSHDWEMFPSEFAEPSIF